MHKQKKLLKLFFLNLILIILSLHLIVCYSANNAILIDVKGAIGPATQDYIQRNLQYAKTHDAELIILRLDTPGGLETSMREINKAILSSPIPVVTYVAPEGARAASAGTFILYASHIAVMAPGTNLGAASPVNITNISFDNEKNKTKNISTLEKKSMNDAAAYIRSLAEMRGRNAEWAEKAVREAVSISAAEAAKLKVIDFIAQDVPDVLHKLQGRKINIGTETHILQTSNFQIEQVVPDWRYQFLSIITDPSIAYLLFLIGIYGLFFEFYNPGFVLPGVTGGIALLLALYAFQLLPINYVGFALILLGIAFMIIEIFVSSFGVLGFGGILAFIIGSIFLLDTSAPGFSVAWQLILAMSLVSAGFFFIIANLAILSMRKKIVSGKEALIGKEGIVLECTDSYMTVRVGGEIWQATSIKKVESGQKIRVLSVIDLRLLVEPCNSHGD